MFKILLIFANLGIAFPTSNSFFSDSDYLEAKRWAEELLKRCPPENCDIIILGRSPTFVFEILEHNAPKTTFNIPLSKFRPDPDQVATTSSVNIQGHQDFKRRLFDHFEKYVPSGKRAVLIADYTETGRSMHAFHHYLQLFYKGKGISPRIKSIGYAYPSYFKASEFLESQKRYRIDQTEAIWSRNEGFLNGVRREHEQISRFHHFDLRTDGQVNLRKSPLRQKFLSWIVRMNTKYPLDLNSPMESPLKCKSLLRGLKIQRLPDEEFSF